MKLDANKERYDEREIYCVKKERYTGKEIVWKNKYKTTCITKYKYSNKIK